MGSQSLARIMNRKYIFVGAIIFALIDVAHWLLNLWFEPYTGLLDPGFHFLIAIAAFWYVLTAAVAVRSAMPLVQRVTEKYAYVYLVALVAVIAGEIAYMELMGYTRMSSATYKRMFPMYAGGLLPALLTYVVAANTVESRFKQISMCLISIAWLMGPIVVDSMGAVEGGARGTTNVLQSVPVFGTLFMLFTYVYAFGMLLAIIVFIPILIYGIYMAVRCRAQRLHIIALTLSGLALCYCVLNWGGFIWD